MTNLIWNDQIRIDESPIALLYTYWGLQGTMWRANQTRKINADAEVMLTLFLKWNFSEHKEQCRVYYVYHTKRSSSEENHRRPAKGCEHEVHEERWQ